MNDSGWTGVITICLTILGSTALIALLLGGMKANIKTLLGDVKALFTMNADHKEKCDSDRAVTRTNVDNLSERVDKHSTLIEDLRA